MQVVNTLTRAITTISALVGATTVLVKEVEALLQQFQNIGMLG